MDYEKMIVKRKLIDNHFKSWLECNFGFYSSGILINTCWDSNVIYQYDYETQTLKSSFDDLKLNDMEYYSIEKYERTYILSLFDEENMKWCSYMMCWISEEIPEHFKIDYLNEK